MKARTDSIRMTRIHHETQLAQRKAKQSQKETNTHSANAIAAWSLTAGGLTMVKELLEKIPKLFFPDNPAKDPIMPFLKFSYWSGFFLQWISPVALAMSYLNVADSVERFYKTENRNYERYLDLFVSVTTAAVSTAMFCLGGAKVAIILTLGAAVLNASYGLFNTFKHFAYALFAKTKADRKEHLINAGKQFISIFTHSLSFAATFLLGVKMSNAETLESIGNLYRKVSDVFTALTISTVATIAANSAKKTLGTLQQFIQHPSKTLSEWATQLKQNFRAHPVKSILKLPFQIALFPLRILTLPIQLTFYGVYKGLNVLLDRAKPIKTDLNDNPIVTSPTSHSQIEKKLSDSDKLTSLKQRALEQTQEYKKQYTNEEARMTAPDHIRAKWHLLEKIATEECNPEALNQYENEARKISSGLYSSFFRRKSRTLELMDAARELTHNMAAPAA